MQMVLDDGLHNLVVVYWHAPWIADSDRVLEEIQLCACRRPPACRCASPHQSAPSETFHGLLFKGCSYTARC